MYCMECGAEIVTETKFCGRCGASQIVVESAAVASNVNLGDPKVGTKSKEKLFLWIIAGVVIFALLIVTTTSLSTKQKRVQQAEWVEFDKDDKVSTTYADTSSILRAGNNVKMWVLEDFITAETLSGVEYWSEKRQYEFDCKEAQARKLGITAFSGHMGLGNVLHTSSVPETWKTFKPYSGAGLGWKFACKEQKQKEVSSAPAVSRGSSIMKSIYDKTADDMVEKYEIAKRNGKPMDVCVQAMMVSAAYLQAKDEQNYQRWKEIEGEDCARAGMPR